MPRGAGGAVRHIDRTDHLRAPSHPPAFMPPGGEPEVRSAVGSWQCSPDRYTAPYSLLPSTGAWEPLLLLLPWKGAETAL